jgi:integrase
MGSAIIKIERGIFRRGKSVFIDFVVHGTRIYENLGPVSVQAARAIMSKLATEAAEGRYGMRSANRSLTVRDVLNCYWEEHLRHLKSGKNARFLLSSLDNRIGGQLVSALKKPDLVEYQRARARDLNRSGGRISPRTVQAEMQMFNLALNHAVDTERLQVNHLSRFCRVEIPEPKKVVLDEGFENGPQWQGLYNGATDHLKPILLTLYETGMRLGEVLAMRREWWVEVDTGLWVIEIPQAGPSVGPP